MKLYEIEEPRVHYGNAHARTGDDLSDFIIQGFFILVDYIPMSKWPKDVGEDFHIDGTSIRSLHNIHKSVHRIGGTLYLPGTIERSILGVLQIRDVEKISAPVFRYSKLDLAIRINKYLKDKPNPMQRDIHKCQEEMIEAGLEEYAQL